MADLLELEAQRIAMSYLVGGFYALDQRTLDYPLPLLLGVLRTLLYLSEQYITKDVFHEIIHLLIYSFF